MKKLAIVIVAVLLMACMIPVSAFAQLAPYSQDFEGLTQSDPGALAADGWLVFANVFGPDWAYWYGYGVFGAPNDGLAFCQIVLGEGGGEQGDQQLVTFSDYQNADHAAGAFIETNLFQEQTVVADNVGQTWVFDFQAKMGNLVDPSTALAFIKTLDPNAGYATTNFITEDMTSIDSTWGSYSLTIDIDASLEGQILQIGFMTVASNYDSSGIFYDNINFYIEGSVATESTSWDNLKSLYR
jgi:hypothetical protein